MSSGANNFWRSIQEVPVEPVHVRSAKALRPPEVVVRRPDDSPIAIQRKATAKAVLIKTIRRNELARYTGVVGERGDQCGRKDDSEHC